MPTISCLLKLVMSSPLFHYVLLCEMLIRTSLLCHGADDDDASSTRKKSADTTKSAKTLQERMAARHSAKLEKAGR